MAVYFIDYENVRVDGLKGVSKLGEDDSVCIFYSEKANTLTFGLHRRLCECKADIEYFKVATGTPNSLDFQLTSLLGFKVARDETQEYVIVSKDKGFDSTVEFWSRKKIDITRVEDITTDVQNSKNELMQEITTLIGKENATYSAAVFDAITQRKSKEGIHNFLMKELHDNKKVTELYKKIKPLLKDKS
ncbi:MAG: hypothetical protein IKK49_07190 [Clostridia bacterium]|nr:hypothetical protein [Clostridia bacterium]